MALVNKRTNRCKSHHMNFYLNLNIKSTKNSLLLQMARDPGLPRRFSRRGKFILYILKIQLNCKLKGDSQNSPFFVDPALVLMDCHSCFS